MGYEVDTALFSGPFDLLLHLILQDEVELYEVSLIDIVDAYLSELEKMEGLDLEVATEFLLIASTLVELKSRRLLPDSGDPDLDEELALWEHRDLLLARLLECKTFKDAAVALELLASDAAKCYPRTAGMEENFVDLVPDLLAGVAGDDVLKAFMRATAPKPKPTVDFDHVAPIGISVADVLFDLAEELPKIGRPITFRELTSQLVDRIEVVVHFLALLELFKNGMISLDQPESFGSITVEWVGGAQSELDEWAVVDAYEG